MTGILNRVKVFTTATGTGDTTAGGAVSTKHMTPAEAGVIDGKPYAWLYEQGNDFELIRAAWRASDSNIVRSSGTVLWSKIGASVSNSTKITLNGTAAVSAVFAAEDHILSQPPVAKSAGFTVVAGDRDTLFLCTGSFTVAFTAAATLGNQFKARFLNVGAGVITLDPNGAELLDGAATATLNPGENAHVECDASAFYSVGSRGAVRFDLAQAISATQKIAGRSNIYAAPFDAIGYFGSIGNGAFAIDQRSAGNLVTGVNGYAIDRWKVQKSGSIAFNAQQVSDAPPGHPGSLKVTVTTAEAGVPNASDWATISTVIEGFDTSRLQWGGANAQPIAIPLWTKIHRTGTYSGAIRNAATNRSYIFTFTQNVADTWEYKPFTIPGDQSGTWIGHTNGVGLELVITIGSGSSNLAGSGSWVAGGYLGATGTTNGFAATSDVFQVAGINIFPGSEYPVDVYSHRIIRPFSDDLQRCKRYFESSFDYGVKPANAVGNTTGDAEFTLALTSGSARGQVHFQVEKRVAPAMTGFNPVNNNSAAYNYGPGLDFTNGQLLNPTTKQFRIAADNPPAGSALGDRWGIHWTADDQTF